MADLRNETGNNNVDLVVDQPVMRDYLQSTRTTTLSCMVVPANAVNFKIKLGVIQLLTKSHGLDSKMYTYTSRNSMNYVQR